jgi:hypothetical protein
MLRGALLAVALLAGVQQADATCYLLDTNSACAVCWTTTYSSMDDTIGFTQMSECPAGVLETWTKPLPEKMNAEQEYDVGYSLQLDMSKFGQLRKVCIIQIYLYFLKKPLAECMFTHATKIYTFHICNPACERI